MDECPECGAAGSVVPVDGTERACDECGLVVSEDAIDHGPEWRAHSFEDGRSKSRVGAPENLAMHDKGLTTHIDWRDRDAYGNALPSRKRRRMRRLRTWQERARTKDSRERSLRSALNEVNRMSSALGVPQSTREGAAIIYRRALEEDLIRGHTVEGVASAAVYASCRTDAIPRSLEEVAAVSRVDRTEIARTYRYVSRELGLELAPVDPVQYLPRFASELGLSPATEAKAAAVIEAATAQGLLSGRSPTGFAAAAIYTAGQLTGERVSQREVAAVAGVTTVTIRHRSKEQLAAMGGDAA